MTLRVQLSKKKGCRTKIESPITEGGVCDLHSFSDALKVGLLMFLELSSKRIP